MIERALSAGTLYATYRCHQFLAIVAVLGNEVTGLLLGNAMMLRKMAYFIVLLARCPAAIRLTAIGFIVGHAVVAIVTNANPMENLKAGPGFRAVGGLTP